MARLRSRTSGQQLAQPVAWLESQGLPAEPSTVQRTWLPPFPRLGHAIVSHAPDAQVRSHWQAAAQLMSLHALSPEQLIEQRELSWQPMS